MPTKSSNQMATLTTTTAGSVLYLLLLISITHAGRITLLEKQHLPQQHLQQSVKVLCTVFCDSCISSRLTKNSILLEDAQVQIECGTNSPSTSKGEGQFKMVATSNSKGEFSITLPKSHYLSCSFKLLNKLKMESCSVPQLILTTSEGGYGQTHNLMDKPIKGVSTCSNTPESIPSTTTSKAESKALTLGPPDPPKPDPESTRATTRVKSEALTLGPPDPPLPDPESTTTINFESKSYHLGPPDPPKPTFVVSKSYRLGPPNPPQPIFTPRHG